VAEPAGAIVNRCDVPIGRVHRLVLVEAGDGRLFARLLLIVTDDGVPHYLTPCHEIERRDLDYLTGPEEPCIGIGRMTLDASGTAVFLTLAGELLGCAERPRFCLDVRQFLDRVDREAKRRRTAADAAWCMARHCAAMRHRPRSV
jgi:hypothetical protein